MRTEAILAFDQGAFAAGARHRVAVQRTVQPLVRIQLATAAAAADQLFVQFALQKAFAFVCLNAEIANLLDLLPSVQALLQILGHFGKRFFGLQNLIKIN